MKNKFLEKVSEQIADDKSRELITAELESHLLDKIDYYVDIGYSKEEAEKRATEEMGNPDDTAVPLNALHNNNFRDLISFICCGVIVIMFLCTIWFRDDFIYIYDSTSYRHSIICDFVSISFLIIYAVILILARKKRIKIIPLFVAISFVLQFFTIFIYDYQEAAIYSSAPPNMFYFYQPAMYALVKIFTEGFSAYSQCVFIEIPAIEGYLTNFCFEVLPYIFGIIFIVWSILLFIKILREESLSKHKKYRKPVRIIEICVSIFLSVNFLAMTSITCYKAITDFATENSFSDSSLKMLEYVLNADLTKDKAEILNDLAEQGYYESPNFESTYYSNGGNISLETGMDNNGRLTILSYHKSNGFNSYTDAFTASIDEKIIYTKTPEILNDINAVKKINIGTTFESIKKSGLLRYTKNITKTYYKDKNKTVYTIYLLIYFYNNSDYDYCSKGLTIEDGKVTDYYD